DLVGAGDERRRYREAERFGSLKVDGKLEFCWLHDWQISRFFALQDAARINPDPTIAVRNACAISHQPSNLYRLFGIMDDRNSQACSHCYDLFSSAVKERSRRNRNRVEFGRTHVRQYYIEFSVTVDGDNSQLLVQRSGSCLDLGQCEVRSPKIGIKQ